MFFKRLKGLFVYLLLILGAPSLFAEIPVVHPLGIVLRPNLIRKLINELNQKKVEGKNISLEICRANQDYLSFDFSAGWKDPKWLNLNSNQIYLETKIFDFVGHGKYMAGCTTDPKTKQITVTSSESSAVHKADLKISDVRLGIQLDAQNMWLQIDRSRVAEGASNMQITLEGAPETSKFLNLQNIREALLNEIFDAAEDSISDWLKQKLRGLVFVQSAGEALKDNPIWKKGPLVEKGAITLELVDRNSAQQYLTFAFNPFRQNSSFASSNGLELYFNATFLNVNRIKELSGLDPMTQPSNIVLDRAREALTHPSRWSTASFQRPRISQSTSDFSLVIPSSLTNEAWTNFYQEQLLKLRTTINIGKQTKGLIADEEQSDHYIITTNPHSAPKMSFEANKFKLEVEDYVMDFGNSIEDRIIPTTQIQSKVSVSASLKVDSKSRMVKMVLDASQFDLKLKDLKGRFTDDEILLFQNMANTVWKDFFNAYAEFEIFPTVFDTDNMPIEIQDVSVEDSSVILDMNLLLRGATR